MTVKAARTRANALGFTDVRAAVRHYLAHGKNDAEIARLLGLARNAVRYHRRVLSLPGAKGAAFGFAPKVYRAVIEGMCEDMTVAEIAERTGMTEAQIQRYADEINASGLFRGLECETCALYGDCLRRTRCGWQALCELDMQPPVQREATTVLPPDECVLFGERVYHLGRRSPTWAVA